MAAEEEILALMRFRGPVLPADVGKTLKINLIIASAYLSELASRQKVKISHLKIGGGSPLYYLPGQEARLQEFAKNLGEKDYRAYELLREKKVVRDSMLDPLMRVALRNIKDFAFALTVTSQGGQETFWKWYLLPDDEVRAFINNELEVVKKEAGFETGVVPAQEQFVPVQQPIIQGQAIGQGGAVSAVRPATQDIKKETAKEKEVNRDKEVMKGKEEIKEKGLVRDDFVKEKTSKENEAIETVSHPLLKEKEKMTVKKTPRKKSGAVGFSDSHVRAFFSEKEITIIAQEDVTKATEFTYIVGVPSPVGQLLYLCKVRQTNKCTDKDIGSALIEGQLKKLPVLFLYTGELTPKADELAKTDMFKTFVIYHL